MATMDDLALKYADYILFNRDNPNVVFEIVNRINGLTFTNSQKHLNSSEKKELINKIEENLLNPRKIRDRFLIKEAEDSRELIKLIQMIRSKT